MGEVRVPIIVENPRTGAQSEELIAFADTGATLSVVPATTLRELGIESAGRVSVVLADGRRVLRSIGNDPVQRRLVPADFLLY